MVKRSLGELESKFFAYIQMRGKKSVETREIVEALNLTKDQVTELFRRLSRGGLIARVRPGLYLVPDKLPVGGSWTPDEIMAINKLMDDRGGKYQICGPNAFNMYGFTEQMPSKIYAYNNVISGDRSVGLVMFSLIKVSDSRLGGIDKIESTAGCAGIYSSRVRTLIDAIYDWSRFDSLPEAYGWTRQELSAGRVESQQIVEMAVKFSNTGTCRRLGFLLEKEKVGEGVLKKLEKEITNSSSFIPFIPDQPKKGSTNKRWGIVDNEA